jgi:hypothetical protein
VNLFLGFVVLIKKSTARFTLSYEGVSLSVIEKIDRKNGQKLNVLAKRQSIFQIHVVSLFVEKYLESNKDFFIILNQKNMDSMFLIFGLDGQEIFFILIIVLLLLVGNKLPELMRGSKRY